MKKGTELAVIDSKIVKEALSPRIDKLYDLDLLAKRCAMLEDGFKRYGEVHETMDGFYVYIDNGADILGVAHLDFVASNVGFVSTEWSSREGYQVVTVWNGALDDRLGVFLLLDVLPTMGLEYDILLTTGEEKGRSTAMHFDPPDGKEYKWIFEFDRNGRDVVMYQYDTDENRERLKSAGCRAGWGSFSDIAYLDHLGVAGFNFGTGYYNEHGIDHHAVLNDTEEMCWQFSTFYWMHYLDEIPYVPKPKSTHYAGTRYGWAGYGGYDYYDHYSGKYWNKEASWEDDPDPKLVVDMDVYDREMQRLIEWGVPYDEAEATAWEKARELWDSDKPIGNRAIGMVCETCKALVDIDEMYNGECVYCRTVQGQFERSKGLHSHTEAEWEELGEVLEGGH